MRFRSYRFTTICLAFVLLVFLAASAWAQSNNGSVRGTVQDQTKAVIPNVTVVLTNTATGGEAKSISNGVGFYVFPAVAPGPYKITAESAGMKKFEVTATVQTQQSMDVNITLTPAGTETVVSVQDVTPMVTTDNPTLSHTLERQRIEQLPINGRNIVNLLNTVPGVTLDTNGNWRTYGVREGTADFVLDGAALTDQLYGGGTVARPPSLDSIQEFRVEVNASSAKFTRQTSIIMTTKGGTNDVHGSLFLTNRNNGYGVARARDNFTNTAAKLNRNEYGGTVGGPVFIPKVYNGKNRTFWFFSYEGYKQRTGGFGNYKVPTDAMRSGDFSGLVNSEGTFFPVYNPFTTDPVTFSRQQFNYGGTPNRIDPALQSPLMKYIYSVLPEPNRAGVNPLVGNNFSGPAPSAQNQYTWAMRFDHRFSDKDQVYARLTNSVASVSRPAAGGVPTLDGFGNSRTDNTPNKSMSADWTHSFSPSFFNEVMFSATRSIDSIFSGDPSKFYSTELGLPNPNGQPGYPVINNIGVGTGRGNYFQPVNWRAQFFNYFILEDNGTKVHGKHEIQFGAHLRYDQLTYMPQQQRTAGSVTFQSLTTALYDPEVPNRTRGVLNTGNVAAAAYLGLANYEARIAKGKYYMRQNEDALYIQDNFRATNRLTLNLGLRWQFSPYPKDKYDIFTSFDAKTMSIVLGRDLATLYKVGATTPALINVLQNDGAKFAYPQDVGLPQGLVTNNWHDIGPHVGFAYRGGDGKKSFVLRGGFSTSYFPIPIWGWNDRMRNNAPFAGFYQNYALSVPAQSPDGKRNWGLVGVPTIVAGKNSSNIVNLDNPTGITIGEDAFQAAYFKPSMPSARVHDWNLTLEKEVLSNTIVRVAYVGNHAANQDSYSDWNQQIPAYVWYMTKREPIPDNDRTSALIRPNPTYPYGDLQEFGRDGWMNGNGAQVEIERRYSKGFGFQLMYTMMNVNRAAAHGWYGDSAVAPVSSFMPGEVPTDYMARMRSLLYFRDTTVPKHEIRWNWIMDLPIGKGKPLGKNVNSIVNAFIGGWQVSGMGRWRSTYFMLPAGDSDLWPTGTPVEYYGHQYPIQDCRDGGCLPGYLMWNGYIPAHQINSVDADGKPNGIMGVPANYKAAVAPAYPYPANYNSLSAENDPLYDYYGGSTSFIKLNDGTVQEVGFAPRHPYASQPIASTNRWNCDAALFKSFSIKERAKLRIQADFFNVFNTPGNESSAGSDGIVGTWYNMNDPRVVQLSARFTW
jgi:hypothetical protein